MAVCGRCTAFVGARSMCEGRESDNMTPWHVLVDFSANAAHWCTLGAHCMHSMHPQYGNAPKARARDVLLITPTGHGHATITTSQAHMVHGPANSATGPSRKGFATCTGCMRLAARAAPDAGTCANVRMGCLTLRAHVPKRNTHGPWVRCGRATRMGAQNEQCRDAQSPLLAAT